MEMSIKVHISKLTVEGTARADALRAGHTVRTHLASLLAQGISPVPGRVDRIDAGETPAGSIDRAGRHVAERIFSHLKGGNRG
jgi:hypothetical protein